MSQTARTRTTSTPEAFHPDALSAIAALAAGGEQPAWHERALCAQTDPEAFFPENGASTRDAKQICSRCPVRAECLEDALSRDERFGVWGATSETERRVLRRARPVAAAGPAVSSVPAVLEQRTNRARPGRESVPPPGRRAGSGVAGTLPTEPRGRRDQLTRPASTFPARARCAPEPSGPPPAPATRRPATPGSARETPTRRARGATRLAQERPPAGVSSERTSDANPATETAADTAAAVESGTGAASDDDVAAAAPKAPPDPSEGDREHGAQRELHDVAKLILDGQGTALGTALGSSAGRQLDRDLDAVDLERVLALVATMVDGSPVTPARTGRGLWERRIAAVTAVLGGTLTRGKTARAMGERSQDIAHWVAAHQAGMVLVRGDEQRPGGDDTAQGGAATPRPASGAW